MPGKRQVTKGSPRQYLVSRTGCLGTEQEGRHSWWAICHGRVFHSTRPISLVWVFSSRSWGWGCCCLVPLSYSVVIPGRFRISRTAVGPMPLEFAVTVRWTDLRIGWAGGIVGRTVGLGPSLVCAGPRYCHRDNLSAKLPGKTPPSILTCPGRLSLFSAIRDVTVYNCRWLR